MLYTCSTHIPIENMKSATKFPDCSLHPSHKKANSLVYQTKICSPSSKCDDFRYAMHICLEGFYEDSKISQCLLHREIAKVAAAEGGLTKWEGLSIVTLQKTVRSPISKKPASFSHVLCKYNEGVEVLS